MTVNDVVNGFKARLRGAYPAEEVDAMTRVVMEEVLHGARPTLAEIEELCKHEKIGDGTKSSIGFQA